jgi:transcriptional regulator with XRE-family HTH domain
MNLGTRIQTRMTEKGWKLSDLARATNVAKGYLSEILSGKATRPSAVSLDAIAQALGTSVPDLLGTPNYPGADTVKNALPSLLEFAATEGLPEQDIKMLAGISFRNAQPKTANDWRYLWESIKRSVGS